MAQLKFGETEERVVTREEFSLEKAREVLKDEVVAVLGYGVQSKGERLFSVSKKLVSEQLSFATYFLMPDRLLLGQVSKRD